MALAARAGARASGGAGRFVPVTIAAATAPPHVLAYVKRASERAKHPGRERETAFGRRRRRGLWPAGRQAAKPKATDGRPSVRPGEDQSEEDLKMASFAFLLLRLVLRRPPSLSA